MISALLNQERTAAAEPESDSRELYTRPGAVRALKLGVCEV
jgi:hypothetical protein